MNGADLFADCLVNEGVSHIFAVPGEETIAVVEALSRTNIELVVTRHEQHAAFMAAAHGRLTGRAGVCLSTLGPGALNLATGLAHAKLGGMPLVAITGQKPNRENDQARFQLVDIIDTFAPLTKATNAVADVRSIPSRVRHAFRCAEDERPGPVHIELAQDIAGANADGLRPCNRVIVRRPVPDGKAVTAAATQIEAAKRPIVIAAGGANRARVAAALTNFAETSGIYVVTTQMGKGAIAESHPQSLRCLGAHRGDYVHELIEQADLIVTIGYNLSEYPPSVWNPDGDATILHIDFSPAEPGDFYAPCCELIGDIASGLDALSKLVPKRSFDGLARARNFIEARLDSDTHVDTPTTIVRQLQAAMDDNDTLVLDNGGYKFWVARGFPANRPNAVILDDALATMGAGLAGAMTAKLLEPSRRVVALCGDGGFAMNLQDLETAVRLALDLVIVVVRDDAYGLIGMKQRDRGLEARGVSFNNPSLAKLAEAFGARALCLDDPLQLTTAMTNAFESGGVVLIDCPIDYNNVTVSAPDAIEILEVLNA